VYTLSFSQNPDKYQLRCALQSTQMKRRPSHELLDTDSGTPEEVAASLLDLRSINLRFGGIATTRSLIERVSAATGRRDFSLLEVAAGEGFVPQRLSTELERRGIRLKITLLDRVVSHLPKNGSASKLAADALNLPFHDSSFDLVSCSLFVHHLTPEQAVAFAKEVLRVCRVAVLVNDLIRHPLHLALVYAGTPWYRSRITRNDAPASVRQAYTVKEMRNILRDAGLSRVEIERHFLYRMGVIAWKTA
jgi:ubiquinone/menaquinone biosynthesis C-methylase UbiE